MSYDASNFNFAIAEIARTANVPVQAVVDLEAGKVLEIAIKETYTATAGSIRASYAKTRRPGKQKAQAAALRARGLSKRVWLELSRLAGLIAKAPTFVQRATPSDGRTYANENVTRRAGNRPSIQFWSDMPTLNIPSVKARHALYSALGRREKFFRTNLELGVFKQLATIAKKYPGLTAR